MRPVAAAALALSIAAPARALTNAQLANQVRKERRDYDNAMANLERKRDNLNQAEEKLNDLRREKDDGDKFGKVGGVKCRIDGCIGKEQRIVAARERAAENALETARNQAQQYVNKENQYAGQTGHPLDPESLGTANDFLAGPRPPPGGVTQGPTDVVSTPPTATGGCNGKYDNCIPDPGPGTDDPDSPVGGPDGQAPGHGNPGIPPNGEAGYGGGPGSKVGDLGTGHEADDLAKFASKGAEAFGASGSHSLGSTGGGAFGPGAARGAGGEDPVASGRADLQRGDITGALAAARMAERANPRNFKAVLLDAEVRNAAGDWKGAEDAARSAITLNPNDPRGYEALAVSLLHQGRNAEALEAANKAVEKDPEDASAYMLRAFAFEGLGQKDKMLKDVERAAALDPARFGAYLKLARLGKVLFDRKRTMKGWHGFPVPDLGEDDLAAPAAGGAGRGRLLALGGVLVAGAAGLLGFALWKKRRDPTRITVRTGPLPEPSEKP